MRSLAGPILLTAIAAAQPSALSDLPLPPPVGDVVMFSSRDPSGGNQDWGHYPEVRPDGRAVLARVTGPGRIRRIWSADPRGELEIRLDGEVVFAGAFAQLFDGSEPGFAAPLAGRSGGGCTSWVPMPFVRACEVTAPHAESIYYQIEIAFGAQARRFAADDADLAAERARLALPPTPGDDVRVVRAGGGEPILLHGAGEVVCLRVRLAGDADLRRPWLQVHADGEPRPCLSGPVALVFGLDPEPARDGQPPALHTLVTADGDGGWRELRLPMPFRTGLRLCADGVAGLEAAWRPLPAGHARRVLHGRFRCATTRRGEPFVAVDAHGPGHLVGTTFACAGASGHGLSFLEGDERIEVDGGEAACGTGTEDFFSGAWYFRGGPFAHPFHAVATIDGDAARAVMARWLIVDPIPFARSLHFAIEHGGRNDAPGCHYAALTFFYADAATGHRDDADERAA